MKRATGTELAGMRLALGVLRRGVIWRFCRGVGVLDATGALDIAMPFWSRRVDFPVPTDSQQARLLRARLALYLRARLRMERGEDGGRWECESCGDRETGSEQLMDHLHGRPVRPSCCDASRSEWTTRITPLWEHARSMEVSHG